MDVRAAARAGLVDCRRERGSGYAARLPRLAPSYPHARLPRLGRGLSAASLQFEVSGQGARLGATF